MFTHLHSNENLPEDRKGEGEQVSDSLVKHQ